MHRLVQEPHRPQGPVERLLSRGFELRGLAAVPGFLNSQLRVQEWIEKFDHFPHGRAQLALGSHFFVLAARDEFGRVLFQIEEGEFALIDGRLPDEIFFFMREHEKNPARLFGDPGLVVGRETAWMRVPAFVQAVELQRLGHRRFGTAIDLKPVVQTVFGVDPPHAGLGEAENRLAPQHVHRGRAAALACLLNHFIHQGSLSVIPRFVGHDDQHELPVRLIRHGLILIEHLDERAEDILFAGLVDWDLIDGRADFSDVGSRLGGDCVQRFSETVDDGQQRLFVGPHFGIALHRDAELFINLMELLADLFLVVLHRFGFVKQPDDQQFLFTEHAQQLLRDPSQCGAVAFGHSGGISLDLHFAQVGSELVEPRQARFADVNVDRRIAELT